MLHVSHTFHTTGTAVVSANLRISFPGKRYRISLIGQFENFVPDQHSRAPGRPRLVREVEVPFRGPVRTLRPARPARGCESDLLLLDLVLDLDLAIIVHQLVLRRTAVPRLLFVPAVYWCTSWCCITGLCSAPTRALTRAGVRPPTREGHALGRTHTHKEGRTHKEGHALGGRLAAGDLQPVPL